MNRPAPPGPHTLSSRTSTVICCGGLTIRSLLTKARRSEMRRSSCITIDLCMGSVPRRVTVPRVEWEWCCTLCQNVIGASSDDGCDCVPLPLLEPSTFTMRLQSSGPWTTNSSSDTDTDFLKKPTERYLITKRATADTTAMVDPITMARSTV
jgi:hypothetical protein